MKSVIWTERKPIDETCTYKYWNERAWRTEVKENTDEDAIEAYQRFIKENRRDSK